MSQIFTFDYTLERDLSDVEIRVTYRVGQHYPATHTQPAEGGECEVISADMIGTASPVTDDEFEALVEVCEARAGEDASEYAAEYADYKYEQKRDERMMEKWS